MGKSSKKIKSDRINALRKQYDCFLEEDKKRQERNEYILGKLDKMAYSTALLPARNNSKTVVNRPSSICQLVYQPDNSTTHKVSPSAAIKQQLSPNTAVQKIDDAYLIQEISKNYILIPKLRSPLINNYLPKTPIGNNDITYTNGMQAVNALNISNVQQPNSNENTDWKSKYEILNILKNEETEVQDPISYPETNENVTTKSASMAVGTYYKIDHKKLNELPERDIYSEETNYKINNETANSTVIKSDPRVLKDPLNVDINSVADIDCKLQETSLDCNDREEQSAGDYVDQSEYHLMEPIPTTQADAQITYAEHFLDHDANYVNHPEYNYAESIHPTSEQIHQQEHFDTEVTNSQPEEKHYEEGIENAYTHHRDDFRYRPDISAEQYNSENIEEQVYIEEQDAESVQVLHTNDLLKQLNDNTTASELGTDNYIDYEHNEIGLQGLTSNTDFEMKNPPNFSSEQMVEQGNVDVVVPPVEQQPSTEAVTEFKEVDKESADAVDIQAFDAEQRDMFYSEHPAEGYLYDQDINIDNQQSQQNENYQPQNINYYEGTTLQQQTYPVELEEEEAKLRYDPSYHQQYVDPYEKAYNQQQAEYENTESYEQMEPVYDPVLYENSDQIQSVLDTEDGYNETKSDGIVLQADEIKKPDAKNINPEVS